MQTYGILNLFLLILGYGVALAVPFTLLWLWIVRRGWASVRMLALWCGLFTFVAGGMLWLQVRETWLLTGTLICALIASLMVLTWPVTAPRIIRILKLKW